MRWAAEAMLSLWGLRRLFFEHTATEDGFFYFTLNNVFLEKTNYIITSRHINEAFGDSTTADFAESVGTGGFEAAFDDATGILYSSNPANGIIERYDVNAGTALTPYDVGGTPLGVSLSADGGTLFVAQGVNDGNIGSGIGGWLRVDTTTGAIETFSYDLETLETGSYDIHIDSQGQLLVTTTFNGSGSIAPNVFDGFAANPVVGNPLSLSQWRGDSTITVDHDGDLALIAEAGLSGAPFHIYSASEGDIIFSGGFDGLDYGAKCNQFCRRSDYHRPIWPVFARAGF